MSEADRFWSKVVKTDTCWNWTASTVGGYGAFMTKREGKSVLQRANRYSFEMQNGPIPKGQLVCHSCDNRSCVNPSHLFLGTHKQNTQDMVKKNRHYKPKLTLEQVEAIRSLYSTYKYTQKEIAKQFDISQGMVHIIVNRKQWK